MITLKGRKVKNIQVANVDSRDYPDFVDAYIEYAEFEDGTELSEQEIEDLDRDGSIAQMLAHEECF